MSAHEDLVHATGSAPIAAMEIAMPSNTAHAQHAAAIVTGAFDADAK